jgi:ABC-type cobalamin/Fe3+-siderophores transport system ATPase subunit
LAATKPSSQELRLRVFAGPNGSGKSTIIKSVKNTGVNGHPIDFGYYINADDIYRGLGLMYKASRLAYQAFFFDNSKENEPFELVAHFKLQGKKKRWDKIKKNKVSAWFKKYYVS